MTTDSQSRDLLEFLDTSPTPWHAVDSAVKRLESQGFQEVAWNSPRFPGSAGGYFTRRGGTLAAWIQPEGKNRGSSRADRTPERGFHIVGAHTDSPVLKLKGHAPSNTYGYQQISVEKYGGVLVATWLDRDLKLCGRFAARHRKTGQLRSFLFDSKETVARIPNLAIHLQPSARTELTINPQQHLTPILHLDLSDGEDGPEAANWELNRLYREWARNTAGEEIRWTDYEPDNLGVEAVLAPVEKPSLDANEGKWLASARLDNLASCWTALTALLNPKTMETARRGAGFLPLAVFFDHEEVGSGSHTGAESPFLGALLERVHGALNPVAGQQGSRENYWSALAGSVMLSADMAHALHPNYTEKHDPALFPIMGAGPVLKVNANQRYASETYGLAFVETLGREAGIPLQKFQNRADLACGATIGPISASRLGITTVDLGAPMLAMHSIREYAHLEDQQNMVRLLESFYQYSGGEHRIP